jgi:hypothetical protein
MPTLIRAALVLLIAALAAPASAQAPQYFGLTFPDKVAGFPRGAVVDFEKDHPGLGYGVHYDITGWIVTVFIYDNGIKNIPDSLTAETVTAQFAQARGDIYTNMANRKGKAEDKGRFEIASPDKKARFICGAYLLTENGRQLDSYLCLTTWHGLFVKYRLSTLRANDSAATAKRFVGAWTPLLSH